MPNISNMPKNMLARAHTHLALPHSSGIESETVYRQRCVQVSLLLILESPFTVSHLPFKWTLIVFVNVFANICISFVRHKKFLAEEARNFSVYAKNVLQIVEMKEAQGEEEEEKVWPNRSSGAHKMHAFVRRLNEMSFERHVIIYWA